MSKGNPLVPSIIGRLQATRIEELEAENAGLLELLKLAAFVLETTESVCSWRFEGDGKVYDSAYFWDKLHEYGIEEKE